MYFLLILHRVQIHLETCSVIRHKYPSVFNVIKTIHKSITFSALPTHNVHIKYLIQLVKYLINML